MSKADEPKIKADLELELRMERLLSEITGKVEKPSEEEARKYYQQHRDQFITSELAHAAHIVVHVDETTTEEQALERIRQVKQELEKGTEFEKLADQFSSCPGNGGDLGYFPKGEMVQEFEDVVFAMQPGEISDIVKTPFGYHIIKLYEKKPPRAILFDRVKGQIVERLMEEHRTRAIEDFVDRLKEEASIEEREETKK